MTKGQECSCIYFLVTGLLDLVVERDGKDYLLDTLNAGSTLGGYSIFNETHYSFNAKARTNLTILVLFRDDFIYMADQFPELSDAIEKTSDFLIHNEIPQCDYTIGKLSLS